MYNYIVTINNDCDDGDDDDNNTPTVYKQNNVILENSFIKCRYGKRGSSELKQGI